MHLILPLAKRHLSNVATISWQIGRPYLRGTTAPVLCRDTTKQQKTIEYTDLPSDCYLKGMSSLYNLEWPK